MTRRFVLAALAIVAACGPDEPAVPRLDPITPAGVNPLTTQTLVTARARYRAEVAGGTTLVTESPVRNGRFHLRIPLAFPDDAMHVTLELDAASGVVLVGGTPSFYVHDARAIDVLVGAPGTCELAPDLDLPVARENAGALLMGRYVVVFGGDDAGGASAKIDAYDLLTNTHVTLPDAAMPLGATRVALVDRGRALVVPTASAPFIRHFPETVPASGDTVPVLHPGATSADSIVTIPDSGAVFVGGGPDASPTAAVSWLLSSELVAQATLPSAAPDYAAGGAETGLWMVSNAAGECALVQLQNSGFLTQTRIQSFVDGVRHGGTLFLEPTGFRMLLIGGTDTGGSVRADTVYLSGCPVACANSIGPNWTTARAGAAFDSTGVIAGGDGPSALVDRVTVDANGPRIDTFATLVRARTHASVVRLPSGPALVFGGRDASGLVAATEICFPPPGP